MPFMRVDIFILIIYKLYKIKLDIKDLMCLCAFFFADYGLCFLRTIIGFFLYPIDGKICKCRSPPFINLFLKIQIDRRKEKWQNAQKEESIGIILIL